MLGSLKVDEETERKPETWKTLCLHVGKSGLIVICNIESSTTVLISSARFHDYIRRDFSLKRETLSKWLHHANGAERIRQMAIKLCPSLECHYLPTEKMQKANSNVTSTTSTTSACSEILVTPAWLLVYTLLLNCNHKKSPNQSDQDEKRQKKCAFNVLNTLVTNACEAKIGQSSQTTIQIQTVHITMSCTSHGWLECIRYAEGFTRLNAMLQCCQLTEHNRTPCGLVKIKSLAGMLWHLASICMTNHSYSDFHTCGIAHELCHHLMVFVASGLHDWFLQAKEAEVAQVLANIKESRQTNSFLLNILASKQRPRPSLAVWREDGLKVLADIGYVSVSACVCVCMCMLVCLCVSACACFYLCFCMFVCMYVCMYVYMYVCMYVCVCVYAPVCL